jgi:adenylate kinase family enzyme
VPFLGPDHVPVPPPRRVVVAGTSGAGKTTVAAAIAARLGVPHVEIDGLFHGPGWTPNPDFVAAVERFTAEPAWVTEWQYGVVRPLLADRAQLVVWLDYPRPVVMWQVVRRTVHRRRRRLELWNGNVEPPLHTFFTDPEHIVRWAWNTHRRNTRRMHELVRARSELPVVRLRTRAQTRRWLDRALPDPSSSATNLVS